MGLLTIKDIKHLSKKQLQNALLDALNAQQRQYHRVESAEIDGEYYHTKLKNINSAFYQLAGSFQAIRENNKIPKLYEE